MKKIIAIGIVIIAIFVVGFVYLNSEGIEVEIYEVKKGTFQEYIEVSGKVEYEEKHKVYSELDGVVKEIYVKEGDIVSKGTKLAEGDLEDLNNAIKKAQATYDSARATLEDLENAVKPEQIRQAEAQLEQAKVLLETAKQDYKYKLDILENLKKLQKNDGTSEQSIKDAEILVISAENAIKNAEYNVQIAQNNLDLQKKGVSKHSIDAQKAVVEQAKVQLDELKNKTRKVYVSSEIDGTVLTKYIDKGIAVTVGTLLFEIGEYNSAYIKVRVLTDDVGKIKIGQKAVITGELLNDESIEGEVTYIAPKAETVISSLGVEQQRIEVRIKFDNSSLMFKEGYNFDVDIITEEKESTVYVPEEAVFEKNGKKYVFVVDNKVLKLREVVLGLENKDYCEIVSGIEEKEIVVKRHRNEMKEGMKINELR